MEDIMEEERYDDMEDKKVFKKEDEEELYPNCSEIVWRLDMPKNTKEKIIKALEENDDEDIYRTQTDTFPNYCLSDMFMLFEEVKGKDRINEIKLVYIDNEGGGGNWGYVEECFEIAKRYSKGEITKKEAKKLENKSWHNEDE